LLTIQQKTKNYAWQGWVGDCNLMWVSLNKVFSDQHLPCESAVTSWHYPHLHHCCHHHKQPKKNLAHCELHLICLYSCFVSHICAI
jgi:hypothetical protein